MMSGQDTFPLAIRLHSMVAVKGPTTTVRVSVKAEQ